MQPNLSQKNAGQSRMLAEKCGLSEVESQFLDYLLGIHNPSYRDAGVLVKETRISLGFEQWEDFARLWRAAIDGISRYIDDHEPAISEKREQKWAMYLAMSKAECRRAFLLTPDYPVPLGDIGAVIPEEEWLANKRRIADLLEVGLCSTCTNSEKTKPKRIFSTLQEAAGFSSGYAELSNRSIQRAYECPDGYGWHLTTKLDTEGLAQPKSIKAVVTYTSGYRIEVSLSAQSLDELSIALLEYPETLNLVVAGVEWIG